RAENTSSFSEWLCRSANCLVTCSMRTISRSVGTAADAGTSLTFGLMICLTSQFLREAPLGALEHDSADRERDPGDQQSGPPQPEGLPGHGQAGIVRDGFDHDRVVSPEGDVE